MLVPFVPVQAHEFVPPVVLLVNAIPEPVPLQITGFDGVAVTVGIGFTVIVTV